MRPSIALGAPHDAQLLASQPGDMVPATPVKGTLQVALAYTGVGGHVAARGTCMHV